MRVKKEFVLQKFSDEYMAVAIGEEMEKFNGLIRINEVGAFIWNFLKEDRTEEEIVDAIMQECKDVDRETVTNDVKDFLKDIEPALIKD